MERKINERFKICDQEFLVVKEESCEGCYFYNQDCSKLKKVLGECNEIDRLDKTGVVFREIRDIGPKNVPMGTTVDRKIGEVFGFHGKQYKVMACVMDDQGYIPSCSRCAWCNMCSSTEGMEFRDVSGECDAYMRDDRTEVYFEEVKETLEKSERKPGETFEYEGERYIVTEDKPTGYNCDHCSLDFDCPRIKAIAGQCLKKDRTDGKGVHFVKVIGKSKNTEPIYDGTDGFYVPNT